MLEKMIEVIVDSIIMAGCSSDSICSPPITKVTGEVTFRSQSRGFILPEGLIKASQCLKRGVVLILTVGF